MRKLADQAKEEERIVELLKKGYALTRLYPDQFQILGYGQLGSWPSALIMSMVSRSILRSDFTLSV